MPQHATLSGQVAVVTGTTQGLGEAVARRLSGLGLAGLVLCGRNRDKGEALATLTRNAAFSLLRNRIRVNGLNIGWMNTPGEDRIQKTFHSADDGWLARAVEAQPMGRLLEPAEVARSVEFLATDASGMMSGAIIDFDQSVMGCYETPPQPQAAMALPG